MSIDFILHLFPLYLFISLLFLKKTIGLTSQSTEGMKGFIIFLKRNAELISYFSPNKQRPYNKAYFQWIDSSSVIRNIHMRYLFKNEFLYLHTTQPIFPSLTCTKSMQLIYHLYAWIYRICAIITIPLKPLLTL